MIFRSTENPAQVTLIIKPTKACPAQCLHCAADDRCDNHKMSLEEFEKICKEMAKVYDMVNFIWHGGEPMLMGPEFYYAADKIARRHLKRYHFGMQSNLLLYTKNRKAWKQCFIDLFRSNVGTSWDFGKTPRRYKSSGPEGEQAYSRIFTKNILAFLEDGFQLFTIYVMNRWNRELAPKILETMFELNISGRINYLYDAGRGTLLKDWFVTEEDYLETYEELARLWTKALLDGTATHVEPLYTLLLLYLQTTNQAAPCPWKGNCPGKLFGIEPNGDIYNCSELKDSCGPKYGNIYKQGLDEILASRPFLELSKISRDFPKVCLNCEDFGKMCRGLCLAEKLTRLQVGGLKRTILYRCSTLRVTKKVFQEFDKIELNEQLINLNKRVYHKYQEACCGSKPT